MIFIFDLDHTLFNANKFKIDLARALEISRNKFFSDYQIYFKDRKINYHADKHISLLINERVINKNHEEVIRKGVKFFLKELNKYIYKEGEELLKILSKNRNKLILVSFGNANWQKQKIKNLQIKKYFSKIIITDKNKGQALDIFIKEREPIVIINDNARESFAIERAVGRGELLLVKGPYSRNIRHNRKVYTLRQISKLLT